MTEFNPETHFAPAKRSSEQEINVQALKLRAELAFGAVLDAVSELVFILNMDRQIVYANRRAADAFGAARPLAGLRHGEALGCQNALKSSGGCGTAPLCKYCGAMRALVETALLGKPSVQECRLTVSPGGVRALDLTVSTYPLDIDGERFIVFHAADIAAGKRMEVIGQVFFHDMLNTMTALSGFLDIVGAEASRLPPEFQGYFSRARTLAVIIQDEMLSHRLLVAAEAGHVPVSPVKINTGAFLRQSAGFYGGCNIARGKALELVPGFAETDIETDKSFLNRIINAMLKNALEETEKGGKVALNCQARDGKVVFSVHNSRHMTRETQLQVFTRSFSTKGKGRGLGTWSMKLFGERFLKGRVWFETDSSKGTTFFLELPVKLPA
ncbi:MAG: ATP-binding protein [Elusimicrobiales bacterium]